MKTIVKRRERMIMVYSNVIDDFPFFKELLMKHITVTERMVEKCIDMDVEIQKMLKTNAYKEIYKEAFKEWVAEETFETGELKCSICNRDNKEIYYIKNIINGKRLNVGSDCIKHFLKLRTVNNQLMAEYLKKNRNAIKKVSRKSEFELTYPNFTSKISEIKNTLNNSKYVVRYELYTKANKLINKLGELKSNYLDGKGSSDCFETINELFDELDNIVCVQIPKHNEELESNDFACSNKMEEWLERNNKKIILDKIRQNNSCVDKDTISEIYYLPFVEKHIDKYKKITCDVFYDIRLVDSNLYFTVKNRKLENIVFNCSTKTFMKKLGDILFLSPEHYLPKLKLFFLFSEVLFLDEDYIDEFYTVLNDIFRGEYEFIYDINKEKSYIVNKERLTYVVFSNTNDTVKHILKYFENKNLKYSCEISFFNRLKWKNITNDIKDEISKCRREKEWF